MTISLLPCTTRLRLTLTAVLVLPACCAPAAPAQAASVSRPRLGTQQLATLLSGHTARLAPRAGSREIALVGARRPITGERTTLPVVGQASGPHGTRWLQVRLPGRPNGFTGWIVEKGTIETGTSWGLLVSLRARRVLVYSRGRQVKSFGAVVGKPSTPTPTGRFFVEETIRMPTGEAGGPFALALSARSDALQEFEGGPGQIAIHGRNDLIGEIGTATSHGCVRLNTSSISWLASRLGPGTPVTIELG